METWTGILSKCRKHERMWVICGGHMLIFEGLCCWPWETRSTPGKQAEQLTDNFHRREQTRYKLFAHLAKAYGFLPWSIQIDEQKGLMTNKKLKKRRGREEGWAMQQDISCLIVQFEGTGHSENLLMIQSSCSSCSIMFFWNHNKSEWV